MKFSLNLKNALYGTMFLMSLTFTSCKKGETGPAGPPGTANVLYSDWVSGSAVKDTTIDGAFLKVHYIKADSLTEKYLTSGSVLVYFTYGSSVLPLPYTGNAGGKASTMSFIPKVGVIAITRFTHDNSASVTIGNGNKYRYILIPGGVQTNSTKAKALPVGTTPELFASDSRYSAISFDEITGMFRSSAIK